MKHYGVGVASALLYFSAHADIYKWTDSNGNVSFSDKPRPGAEQVILPDVQTFSSPVVSQTSSKTAPQKNNTKQTYTILKIVSPEGEGTIWDNQGNLNVLIQVQPVLKKGDNFQLIFDGKPIGEPQTAPAFSLTNIDRGTHTVGVQIIDTFGKVRQTSEAVTFYMHKASVNLPNRKKKELTIFSRFS